MEKEINKKYNKKIIVLFSFLMVIFSISFVIFYFPSIPYFRKYEPSKQKKEEWITIFTHGAFGSLLGLLNLRDVIRDNVEGTSYKKLLSKMRKDDFFYKNQPMLEKGLVKIKPSFDLQACKNKKYAIYPITKSYQTIVEQIKEKKEKNNFYTFGWSGLMSQQRRRKEAIRFYNAIAQEVENYNKRGISPKIRIIAHSHGGNLSLNLAGVEKAANNLTEPNKLETIAKNDDEKESLLATLQEIKKLPPKNKLSAKKGQKLLDYIPEKKDLIIDELLMFGTPIQAETESFIFSGIFKKVYNFYSQEDSVQKLDWVTTKKAYSKQRFNILNNIFGKKPETETLPQVIQAKIMIRQNMPINTSKQQTNNTQTSATNNSNASEETSFWSNLFYFIKRSDDPNHKELWFASWENNNLLSPLPAAILSPLYLSVIEKISDKINDVDLILNFTDEKVRLYAFAHNETVIQEKTSIYKWIIDDLKAKTLKWKPEDISLLKEFNIIKKYTNIIS